MASSEPFSANPKSIEKATLSPTDRTIFSVSPSLFNFRILRMRNPGTKVRKRKARTCLKMGISKNTARFVKISESAGNRRKTLVSRPFEILVISLPFAQESPRVFLPFLGSYIPINLLFFLRKASNSSGLRVSASALDINAARSFGRQAPPTPRYPP